MANTQDVMNSGLVRWVDDYKAMRKAGNVKGAKKLRNLIAQTIKDKNLDAKIVWGTDPEA
jgi:hypothetical protein